MPEIEIIVVQVEDDGERDQIDRWTVGLPDDATPLDQWLASSPSRHYLRSDWRTSDLVLMDVCDSGYGEHADILFKLFTNEYKRIGGECHNCGEPVGPDEHGALVHEDTLSRPCDLQGDDVATLAEHDDQSGLYLVPRVLADWLQWEGTGEGGSGWTANDHSDR